jgi:clan AA aspartic protease
LTGRVDVRQPNIGVVFLLHQQGSVKIDFVIDTGFEGTLTLPPSAVAEMQLPFDRYLRANLADDSEVLVAVHRASIRWHGKVLDVSVLAMGKRPLLGTSLLDGNDLSIRFADGGPVSVEQY